MDAVDRNGDEEEDDDDQKKSTVKANPIRNASDKTAVDFAEQRFPVDSITIEDPGMAMRS